MLSASYEEVAREVRLTKSRSGHGSVGHAGPLIRSFRSVTTTRHPAQSSIFSVWNTVGLPSAERTCVSPS